MSNQPPQDMSQNEISAFHGKLISLYRQIQGMPYHVRQALGVATEADSAKTIGDMIDQAEEQIDAQIEAAEQRDDVNTAGQVSALKALKISVPFHFSLGQKDMNWLNETINQIIGEPNSTNPDTQAQASASGDQAGSEIASESAPTQEDTSTGKIPPVEA